MTEQSETPPPRVFISYSWSSADRVIELATRLRGDGVDVVLDRWDLVEGQDLHAFMERMVSDSSISKVLVATDRSYAEKADKRERGVGKEALIISAEVYALADQKKFIPVIFESDENGPCVPVFMRSRIHVDMSTLERSAENYEVLLRAIFEKPLYSKPALGAVPGYILNPTAVVLKTRGKFLSAEAAVRLGKAHAAALVDEYFSAFLAALEEFRIDTTSGEPLDERVLNSVTAFIPYRDEFLGLIDILAVFANVEDTQDRIFEFFESSATFLERPASVTSWDERWYDNFRFILGELLIHTIAVLIRRKLFGAAHVLLSREYNVLSSSGRNWRTCEIFSPYVPVFEDTRNQRLKLNRMSLTADILRNRATGNPVQFSEIMQADLILLLASLMRDEVHYVWMPMSLVYSQRASGPLEFFARAASKRYFPRLKQLFGIDNKEEFVKCVGEHSNELGWRNCSIWLPNMSGRIEFAALANLENLDTRP